MERLGPGRGKLCGAIELIMDLSKMYKAIGAWLWNRKIIQILGEIKYRFV